MDKYKSNILEYKSSLAILSKSLERLSTIRLLIFIFSTILIYFFANEGLLTLLLITVPLSALSFGIIIKRHKKVAFEKKHVTFLKEINEAEILRLENKLSEFPSGEKFVDPNHSYAADLDVFGKYSIFQLLNRTTTESGYSLLAEWLKESASREIIAERQAAIQELTPKLDWRQNFQASGMHYTYNKSEYNKLVSWVEEPGQLLTNQTGYFILCIFLSILSTIATGYFLLNILSTSWLAAMIPFIVTFLLNLFVSRKLKPIAGEIIENTQHNVKILGAYRSIISLIETEKFNSNLLLRLQSSLSLNFYSAANEINRLRVILETLQLRGIKGESMQRNIIYSVFNVLWLLDIYWIILTEKWRGRNRAHLRSWAYTVSEFEVLNSLAGFSYSNPTYSFPEIKQEPYNMHFEMLGHPLIDHRSRVCNDFNLTGRGEIVMITGSNMAGKSTFLRTLGVNLVLSLMGAPCCAKLAYVSQMHLFTSMRTQDNLEEGVSSFYAELKRIEQLLKLIKDGQAIFFLLDEMFKGTNSEDRHRGGFSLIKQLKDLNAFGIISTHDLELAKLAGKHHIVNNRSFNSEIQEGEMIFNYGLSEGICSDFNASELMRRSGINIIFNMEEGW
ncbi:DNA mismatch repair protein MutS [Dyadobacter frigoris]|uniref:MutS-related protein n=1 Tax=Dyadobacter frigoris TaxID=2576211 RepID=UPI0024A430C0|nr:DNA mismatch repair protein MutS [Dyadobacter frigoris]GLU54938.1 DNA mismatch repair protein MutS [Dyadobacter frigoris]